MSSSLYYTSGKRGQLQCRYTNIQSVVEFHVLLHFAKSRDGWISFSVVILRHKLQSGRQVTFVTRANIDQIRKLIEEDPHLSIKMLQVRHINSNYYRCKILPQVINHMTKTRPAYFRTGSISSLIHKTKEVRDYLAEHKVKVLSYPCYRPALASFEFVLFLFADGVHGRNAVHLEPGHNKRCQFTAQINASL